MRKRVRQDHLSDRKNVKNIKVKMKVKYTLKQALKAQKGLEV
jgi:hypothetical protein